MSEPYVYIFALSSSVGSDYLSASQVFMLDSAMPDTQVCMPILTLEDDLVEQTESVLIVASSVGGIEVSGSPTALEIHSRECESLYSGTFASNNELCLLIQLASTSLWRGHIAYVRTPALSR